uniref:Uncharacterized protein n=1 Tax=Panulirus argus virus 1 TaxID=380624 RepID=A0A6G9HDL0_9VIRU|nr:hypothetical protein [Panulirus argus virus 1]
MLKRKLEEEEVNVLLKKIKREVDQFYININCIIKQSLLISDEDDDEDDDNNDDEDDDDDEDGGVGVGEAAAEEGERRGKAIEEMSVQDFRFRGRTIR